MNNTENKEYQITGFDVVYHNNALYYTGGVINELFHTKEGVHYNKTSFKQELSAYGDHREWARINSFAPLRFNHSSVVVAEQLCVIGGVSNAIKNAFLTEPLRVVSISQIGKTGLLGWRHMHDHSGYDTFFKKAVSVGRNVYVFALNTGGKHPERLMWHVLTEDNRLVAGIPLCEIPFVSSDGSICVHNNWIYLLGGEKSDHLYVSEVKGNGHLSEFKLVKVFKRALDNSAMIVFKNHLYIFSGSGRVALCAEVLDDGYLGESRFFTNQFKTSLRRPIVVEHKQAQKLLFVKSFKINQNTQNPKASSELYLGDFDLLPETIEFTPVGV